jgi:hypothetical protein
MASKGTVATNAKRTNLLELAQGFLSLAREEANLGYDLEDFRRIRDAAEKGWLAALQAIDHAMARHGQLPEPGPMAHNSRHRFLEKAGRKDLSEKLSIFADQLHGRIFYSGDVPGRNSMAYWLDDVEQFIRAVSEEL